MVPPGMISLATGRRRPTASSEGAAERGLKNSVKCVDGLYDGGEGHRLDSVGFDADHCLFILKPICLRNCEGFLW